MATLALPLPAARTERALVRRSIDFWLLGGASVVVWAFMLAGQSFRDASWAIDHHYRNVFATSATLALLVNYPHFMASYRLAYSQGAAFVLRHAFQLAAVPIALAAACAAAWIWFDVATWNLPFVAAANGALERLGLATRIGASPVLGIELLGWGVIAMHVTVGWHYTKQTYGCMMVMAAFDGYPLSALQRRLLRYNLYGIWWLSFLGTYTGVGALFFFELPYANLALPRPLYFAAGAFVAVATLATIALVFVRNRLSEGRLPSANFLVPYLALFVWWVPLLYQAEYYVAVVPLFHSLQYLPFVWKVESGRMHAALGPDASPARTRRATWLALGLVLAGFLAFELVPNSADAALGTRAGMNVWFWFVAAQLFINIHHYFIDNVLWRFHQRDVAEHLLR